MKILHAILIACVVLPLFASAQKKFKIASPDGAIVFELTMKDKAPLYRVLFKGKVLVDFSPLGLSFKNGEMTGPLNAGKPVYDKVEEDYELITGKAGKIHSSSNRMQLPLSAGSGGWAMNIAVRVFNDGLAFRYELPEQNGRTDYQLTEEHTAFRIAGNPVMHALYLPSYTTSHEGPYTSTLWENIAQDTLIDMPALLDYEGLAYIAVTEAALSNYAGMYLVKHGDALKANLSPYPGENGVKVKARLPHQSPWRVLMISDRVGALIESNILTNLNEPNKIKDLSWIKPGTTTFPWWNGNILPDTSFAPGNNFETNKYYIDFCARNNIQYHSVVEYGLHQWYKDDGINFQPGPHADVTTPVPGLDMKQICDYAKQQGVGVRVWVHWAALYAKLDTAFAVFERWGLKGMMIDFMDRDDQQMVNIQEEMLQKAAKHHLHVQFHGAYKPTGMHRTYPNEFTREGTLNYENNKWAPGLTPDHDIIMPFTRMLAGSTDYHLGGFRAVPARQYKIQHIRPLMLGTRCHMLGMYVVLENYIPMVCDYPQAYEGQPGFEWLKTLPGTWDETKVLDAKVGEYICVARRRNDNWYIGAITNHSARQITIKLDFLQPGNYTAHIFTDAADADVHPNNITRQTRQVNSATQLTLNLAAGGGAALQLIK
ncbi:glycoside hydrolase family 97 protein [Foetidibacter luteolus]|uniref:glycoside hydrolase family 97 protein n=1 Tax=Foetidibacter luteolus TaxID=2608880 RepID=UPI00129B4570|nr:glycoside hydrolase family 97 protein [Foetidibacter luteolus]